MNLGYPFPLVAGTPGGTNGGICTISHRRFESKLMALTGSCDTRVHGWSGRVDWRPECDTRVLKVMWLESTHSEW